MRARLPTAVRAAVEVALGSPLRAATPVGGGCINACARVETGSGEAHFLKWNADAPAELLAAEAAGLEALGEAGGLRVPGVLGQGAAEGVPWLLLEWIERGRAGPEYGAALGRGVAALHSAGGGEGWGWAHDNFIGSLAQANGACATWSGFWRERRLLPQLRLARRRGGLGARAARAVEAVVERLDTLLEGAEADGPSLVHGDLWGGNVLVGPSGEPVVVDPAPYRGHGEVDLAMAELFGGLPGGFLEAYREARGLGAAYRSHRRPCYQLYYLLVHVNLFGAAYEGPTRRAAEEALGAR